MWGWQKLRGPAPSLFWRVGRLLVVSPVAVALVTTSIWQLSKSRSWQLFGGMVTRVETAKPVVALTFDDGPTAGSTADILAVLDTEGIQATFFLIGGDLGENPEEGQRIAAAGHELGNHTYTHRQMVGVTYTTVAEEIERTDDLIRATGYHGPIHVRPPYGKRFIILPYYLKAHHRRTIYWDVEPESYPEIAASSDRIVEHVLENVRPGSIILLHVMGAHREKSREALPRLIEGVRARGYAFVTVSELLNYGK